MVAFTVKTLEVVTNSFTVVPTTHEGSLSDIVTGEDTVITAKQLVNRVIDYMYSQASNSNQLEAYMHNIDISSFADLLRQAHSESLSDIVINQDTPVFKVINIVRLLDTMRNSEINTNSITAINYLAVTALFKDILDQGLFEQLTDTSVLSDTIITKFTHILNALDTCLFDDVVTGSRYINVSLIDTGLVNETLTNTAELFQYLIDSTSWYASLGLDGNDYLVYVMNTETHGVTEYDNYPFNSMSENLACAPDGIYKLSGDDDSGTPIKSSFKTGLMDFGTSFQKQIPYAYLGITAEGEVLLKSITTFRGIKKERWYKVNTANEAVDSTRVNLGKGVKSRYWQFELTNVDGAAFDISTVELTPLILNRRVK